MKPHNEFMEEVEEASSLPAQTKKALGPESDEDRAMDEGDKCTYCGSTNPETPKLNYCRICQHKRDAILGDKE